jgi:hypothetical protein
MVTDASVCTLMQVSRRQPSQGFNDYTVGDGHSARIVERSHPDCRNRCAALFVSTVSPDSVTDGAALWAPGVDVPPFLPSGYMDKAPRFAGLCTVKRCNGSARCPVAHTAPNAYQPPRL